MITKKKDYERITRKGWELCSFISNNSDEWRSFLTKIYKDGLVEYNDEYVNFNNVIMFVKTANKSVGFNATTISDIPYDEVLQFKTNKISV